MKKVYPVLILFLFSMASNMMPENACAATVRIGRKSIYPALQATTVNMSYLVSHNVGGSGAGGVLAPGDNLQVGYAPTTGFASQAQYKLIIDQSATVAALQLGDASLLILCGDDGELEFSGNFTLTVTNNVSLGDLGLAGLAEGEAAIDMALGGTLSCNNLSYNGTSGNGQIPAGSFTEGIGTIKINGNVTMFNDPEYNTFNNIIFNSSGTITLSQAITVAGDLTISAGILAANASNITMSGSGKYWTNNVGLTGFSAGTRRVTFSGNIYVDGTGPTDFYNITISGTLNGRPGAPIIGILNSWTNNGTWVHGSGTVDFKGSNGTNTILGTFAGPTVFNNITISGTSVATGPATASVLHVVGNWANTGAFNARTGTVIFNGTGAQTLSGTTNPNFYVMTVNKSAGTLSQTNATVSVSNTFNMQAGTLDCLTNTFNGVAGTLVSMTGGAWRMAKITGTPTLPEFPTAANYTVTSGTIVMYGSGSQNILSLNTSGSAQYYNLEIDGTSGTKKLTGDIVVAANLYLTTSTFDISASNYTVRMTGTGTFQNDAAFTQRAGIVKFDGINSVTGTTTTTFYDVTIKSAGATGTLTGHATNMVIQHDFTNNGTYTHNSGKVTFNGTAASTGHVLGSSVTNFNAIDIGSNAYTLVAHPVEMGVAGNLTVTTATFNTNYPTAGFAGDGMITFNGTTLMTTNIQLDLNHVNITGAVTFPSSLATRIFGNWTNNGTFNHNNQLINFRTQTSPGGTDAAPTGTARAQTISGTTTTTFYGLAYNNPGTGASLTLQQDVVVADQLDLRAGPVMLNKKTLTLQNGVANTSAFSAGGIIKKGSVTSAASTGIGYLVSEDGAASCAGKACNTSYLTWNIGSNTGAHVVPFGNASGVNIPFTYNLLSGTVGNLKLATYASTASNTPMPVGVNEVHDTTSSLADNSANTVDRFWHVEASVGTGTADISFTYAASEAPAAGETGSDGKGIVAQQWSNKVGWAYDTDPTVGETWIAYYRNQTPNAATHSVTVNSFSTPLASTMPWALALHAHPLPIVLTDFNVKLLGSSEARVQWITAQEINNNYFEVERSADGVNFTTIEKQPGSGNSSISKVYNIIDEDPLEGVSYYRLKQVDFDNKYTYSSIVPLVNENVFEGIKIFPNPTEGNTDILFRSSQAVNIELKIYNLAGLVVMQKQYQVNTGENKLNLEHSILSSGTYQFVIVSPGINKPYQGKFVKN